MMYSFLLQVYGEFFPHSTAVVYYLNLNLMYVISYDYNMRIYKRI